MEDEEELNFVEEAAIKYIPRMTGEEYCEWEDNQETRYEFIDGEIEPVQAASENHSHIISNIVGETGSFLKNKECKIFANTVRVSVKSKNSYFYPDATIFCGGLEKTEESKHSFKNPSVIFEVLSPSTENNDLGKKFFFYMQIETIKEYIIINSRQVQIRIGRKQPDNSWKFEELNSLEDSLAIETIGFTIKLADLYAGATFNKYK